METQQDTITQKEVNDSPKLTSLPTEKEWDNSANAERSSLSLTAFVDTVFPFDRDEVAEKVAKRHGNTREEVFAEWDAARDAGTRRHSLTEKLLQTKYGEGTEKLDELLKTIPNEDSFVYDQLLDFLNDKCQGWELEGTEIPLQAKGFNLKLDAVFKSDLGQFMLVEFKFGSKLWMKSFDGKKGLGPFSEFDNCKYNKANMQLSFYKKAWLHNNRGPVSALYIVHMNEDVKKTPTVLNPSNKMLDTVQSVWDDMDNAGAYLKSLLDNKENNDAVVFSSKAIDFAVQAGPTTKHEDVMIDMETLSTESNAHILTIGAVRFARNGQTKKLEEMDTFYRRVSFESCDGINAHKSSDTILWWMKQDEKVRKEAFHPEKRVTLSDVLKDFTKWFGKSKYVWSHGSVFDVSILTETYKKLGREPPYKFWNVRDTRTVYDLFNVKLGDYKTSETHHALYDCYNQVQALKSAFIALDSVNKI